LRTVLLSMLIGVLSACQAQGNNSSFAWDEQDDGTAPDDGEDDSSSDDNDDANDAPCQDLLRVADVAVTTGIEQTEELGADHGCVNPWCGEEYLDFPDRAASWAQPVDAADLASQIVAMEEQVFLSEPSDEAPLAAGIIEALRICFLLEDLENQPLDVTIVEDHEETSTTRIQWILINDPLVGTFRLMILSPAEAEEPLPAIIAVHGHGTEAGDFVYAYHGLDYANAGYALVAVDMRANGADDLEREVGWNFLVNGFTLQGIHNYELLQAHRYLRWREDIRSDRIGLLGHSAGSMKGNSLVRITDAFAAYVTDNESEYTSTFDPAVQAIEEDTIPNLYPYTELINDFDTAGIPILHVDYGYPDGSAPLIDFFDEHLLD